MMTSNPYRRSEQAEDRAMRAKGALKLICEKFPQWPDKVALNEQQFIWGALGQFPKSVMFMDRKYVLEEDSND